MIVRQNQVVNRLPTQAGGANDVRDLRRIVGCARIDDRGLLASDQDVGVDEAEVNLKSLGRPQALSVSEPDREIAIPDGDSPAPAPEPEMELAPDRETAQRDLGQPRSATDLLSFLHWAPPVFTICSRRFSRSTASSNPLQEIEPSIQLRKCFKMKNSESSGV